MIRTAAAISALTGYLLVASGLPGVAHRLSVTDPCHFTRTQADPHSSDSPAGQDHDPDRCASCFMIAAAKTALVEVVHFEFSVYDAIEFLRELSPGRVLPAQSGDLVLPRAPPLRFD